MSTFVMTPEVLAGIAGVILSLAFSYVPGLNVKFAALPKETKQLSMAVILLGSSVLIFLLGCGEIIQAGITCDKQGAIQMIWIFITSVIANQSTFTITPQTVAVKAVKQKTG